MKKLITLCVLCTVAVFLSSTALAQDFSASIGIKGWYNSWDNLYSFEEDSDDDVLLIGPSVKVSYGKLFGGVTYLTSTSDYEYDTSFVWEDYPEIPGTYDIEANRSDLDVLAGFMLHPRFGLFGGYKRIVSDDGSAHVFSEADGLVYTEETHIDARISGFAFGATFNYPLPKVPLVLTANGSYMPDMKVDYDEFTIVSLTGEEPIYDHYSESTSYDGYTIEVGLSYTFREQIGFSVGYKYQEIQPGETADELDYDDMEFEGFTCGIDYRF